MFNLTVVALLIAWFIGYGLLEKLGSSGRRSSLSHLPLPPGPKGLPLIGNLMDIPADFAWKMYHRWSTEHGA